MKSKLSPFWNVWCKALGQKASNCDKVSNQVAVVRTAIFVTYFMTNIIICMGVFRHWNDKLELMKNVAKDNITSSNLVYKIGTNLTK